MCYSSALGRGEEIKFLGGDEGGERRREGGLLFPFPETGNFGGGGGGGGRVVGNCSWEIEMPCHVECAEAEKYLLFHF